MNDILTSGEGNLPPGWGYPSPVWVRKWSWLGWFGSYKSGGLVWVKKRPATEQDIVVLKAARGDNVFIDKNTLVGKDDPTYTSFYRRHS